MSVIQWNRLGNATQVANSEMGSNYTNVNSVTYTASEWQNGSTYSGSADTSSSEATTPMTLGSKGCVEFYLALSSYPAGSPAQYILEHSLGSSNFALIVNTSSTNIIVRYGGNSNVMTVGNISAPGDHVAFVWNEAGIGVPGHNQQLYYNGVLVGNAYQTGLTTGAGTLHIGNDKTRVRPLQGTIDNIKIHDTDITDFSNSINNEGFGNRRRRRSA